MNKQVSAVLIAALLSPLACLAQTDGGEPTRAQVQFELAKLESVGYRPVSEDYNYPQWIENAEAEVAELDQQKASPSSIPSATRIQVQSASSAQ